VSPSAQPRIPYQPPEYVPVCPAGLDRRHRYFAADGIGWCQHPTIQSGDILIVDVDEHPREGDYLMIVVGGCRLVRRLQGGQLVGSGLDHDPIALADVGLIEGVITTIQRTLRRAS
jgi:hypothetical protein